MRKCKSCGKVASLDAFPKSNMYKGKRYYAHRCKECDNKRRKADYWKDPEDARWKNIFKLYGVTRAQWLARWYEQGERCAICPATHWGEGRNWQTEHDHVTGKFRGITCYKCNVLLAAARDKVEILASAIAYLERSR